MLDHHDHEWGVPSHDDRHLFELLTLEGAQAGLSWSTILRKREGYRSAFAAFDVAAVASFGTKDVERLLADPGIVRNRLKIESAVNNAARVLDAAGGVGSFDAYLWASSTASPIVGQMAERRGDPGGDRPLAHALSRPEAPRLPLRRPDDLLRVHAVRRPGRRPHGGLFSRGKSLKPAASRPGSDLPTRPAW